LRIEALPTFAMRWLLPRLSQFQRLYPGVELKLSTSERAIDAGTDGFDVAIRRGPGHWPHCSSHEFLEEAEIPVCSPALLRQTPLAVPADLARHTLLHSDTRPDAWSKWLAAAGVNASACRKKQSFNHFYLTLQAAIDGLGVTLGPLPLIADELASGRLVIPLPKPVLRARSYWWIVSRQRAGEALIADFCAWLERASALAPPLPPD
jgi:LysR family glycine cleavage system transcriptional activator